MMYREMSSLMNRAGHFQIFSFLALEKFYLDHILSINFYKKHVVLVVLAPKKAIFRAGHLWFLVLKQPSF